MSFHVQFSSSEPMQTAFSSDSEMTAQFEDYIMIPIADYYDGEYTVTPTDEAQLLPTNALLMLGDITINPIPSNYGRVEWNGSTLTIT